MLMPGSIALRQCAAIALLAAASTIDPPLSQVTIAPASESPEGAYRAQSNEVEFEILHPAAVNAETPTVDKPGRPIREVGRQEDWEATCDNGVHAAMLAVATRAKWLGGVSTVIGDDKLANGVFWLGPDGLPIDPIYRSYLSLADTGGNDKSAKICQFVLRIADAPAPPAAWSVAIEIPNEKTISHTIFVVPGPNDKVPPDQRHCLAELPKDTSSCNVLLSFAAGPWETAAESSRDAKGGWTLAARNARFGAIAFEPSVGSDGAATVTVLHTLSRLEWEYRLLAIDAKGQEHPVRYFAPNSAPGSRDRYEFQMRFEDLATIRFQARPYERMRFKNIVLMQPYDDGFVPSLPDVLRKVSEVGPAQEWKASFGFGPPVTLLGLSMYLPDKDSWWTPDGRRLNEAPEGQLPSGHAPQSVPAYLQPYEFVWRIRRTSRNIIVRIEVDGDAQRAQEFNLINDSRGTLWHRVLLLPKAAQYATVRVGMAGSYSETRAKSHLDSDHKWSPATVDTPRGKVTFGAVEEVNGHARITFTHPYADENVTILGVRWDNKVIIGKPLSRTLDDKGYETVTVETDKPLAALVSVMLDSRPFEWAVFKGIKLPRQ